MLSDTIGNPKNVAAFDSRIVRDSDKLNQERMRQAVAALAAVRDARDFSKFLKLRLRYIFRQCNPRRLDTAATF